MREIEKEIHRDRAHMRADIMFICRPTNEIGIGLCVWHSSDILFSDIQHSQCPMALVALLMMGRCLNLYHCHFERTKC